MKKYFLTIGFFILSFGIFKPVLAYSTPDGATLIGSASGYSALCFGYQADTNFTPNTPYIACRATGTYTDGALTTGTWANQNLASFPTSAPDNEGVWWYINKANQDKLKWSWTGNFHAWAGVYGCGATTINCYQWTDQHTFDVAFGDTSGNLITTIQLINENDFSTNYNVELMGTCPATTSLLTIQHTTSTPIGTPTIQCANGAYDIHYTVSDNDEKLCVIDPNNPSNWSCLNVTVNTQQPVWTGDTSTPGITYSQHPQFTTSTQLTSASGWCLDADTNWFSECSSWLDVGCFLVNLPSSLIKPKCNDLQAFEHPFNNFSNRFPWSIGTDMYNFWTGLTTYNFDQGTSTDVAIQVKLLPTVATTSLTLFSATGMKNLGFSSIFNTIKTLLSMALWLGFAWLMFRISLNLFKK